MRKAKNKAPKNKFAFELPPETNVPELPVVEPKITQTLSEEAREVARKTQIKHAFAEAAELGRRAFDALPDNIKKDLTLRLLQSNSRRKPSDVKKCIKLFTTALLNAAKEHCYLTRRKYYEQENESERSEHCESNP